MNHQPTVFHITHFKAGSQWVAEILKACVPDRFVQPRAFVVHFRREPIRAGAVYPTVYVVKSIFDSVMSTNQHPHHKFFVIRDLRDTIISLYFSLKVSHPLITNRQKNDVHCYNV